MTVYLDLAVLLDLGIDYLLLLAAQGLSGFGGRHLRLLGAAALGGLYSGLCLLPGLSFLGNLLCRCAVLILMGLTAYGCSPSALRRTVTFLVLSLALGGMAVGIRQARFSLLLLEAGLLFLLSRLAFGGTPGEKQYVPVSLSREGRTIHLNALVDTGNSLRDPITGEPVLVVSAQAAQALTGLREEQLRSPVKTLCDPPVPGLRLIPCTTVGGSTMLLALRIPIASIGSRTGPALVAFAPEGLGQGRMYEALTGGTL